MKNKCFQRHWFVSLTGSILWSLLCFLSRTFTLIIFPQDRLRTSEVLFFCDALKLKDFSFIGYLLLSIIPAISEELLKITLEHTPNHVTNFAVSAQEMSCHELYTSPVWHDLMVYVCITRYYNPELKQAAVLITLL